ncbi:MAG TPA: ABC transporter substrate-binding protein [Polyangiaceae bacterium]|nr:ABC transporter substrate-binding protein [Polyangiaceae bacterium]
MLKKTAALCCLLVGCGSSTSRSPDEEVRIGLLLPYTGKDGSDGANYERGVFMAADQINAAGGLFHKPVRIIEADTHSDTARGFSGAQELIAQGVVAIIGPENDELARQLAPVLEAATPEGIALVTPSSSSVPTSTSSDVSLWFHLAPSGDDLGGQMAKHMAASGAKRVAIVSTSVEYELSFAGGVQKRLQGSAQSSVVASEVISTDASNFSSTINAIAAANPDSIVLAADPSTASRFVNQFAILEGSSGYHWYLTPSLEQPGFVLNSFPEIVEGMVGVAAAVTNDAVQAKKFSDAFAQRWQGSDPTTGAYFYYDAMALFGIAFEAAATGGGTAHPPGTTVRAHMLSASGQSGLVVDWNELEKGITDEQDGSAVDYAGITGVISLTSSGARSTVYPRFWTISGGQLVAVAQ